MSALKLLTLLLMPPGLALCAGLLAALLWRRRRRRRVALGLAFLGLGWLWLWSTPFAADRITVALESRYPRLAPASAPNADAILLLGGDPRGLQRECAIEPARCSRTAFAAALHAAHRAPLLLASGGRPDARGLSEAARMRAQLVALGVPDEAILIDDSALNTRENIRGAAPLLEARRCRRILLVTSALHMPRAMANAATLQLDVIAAPSDFDPMVGLTRGPRALLPQRTALMRSQRAMKEIFGLAHQRLLGSDAGFPAPQKQGAEAIRSSAPATPTPENQSPKSLPSALSSTLSTARSVVSSTF